jgi:poly(beta-D-mannuronate) lyase
MFRRGVAGALGCAVLAVSAAGPPEARAQTPALRSPFTVAVQSARRGDAGRRDDLVMSDVLCASPPAPVHDVFGVSYYTDAHHSVADPAKRARNVAQLQPIRDYLRGVTESVDGSVRGDRAAAACSWVWFHAWADASALDGKVNNQGAYEREWTLGGLALAFLKLRDTGVPDPTGRPGVVTAWLAKLGRIVEPPYDGPRASRNNHAYWTGLAVAASGVAANDRALFDWGVAKYRVGADEIAPDGTLPLEMARSERALHYHFYALTPLVMLAELGRANGLDLYAADDGALHRLVKRCLAGMNDPRSFAKPAGAEQDIAAGAKLSVDEIEWIEPYAARFPFAQAPALLQRYRPFIDPRLGGNLTAVYAKKTAPP